VLWVRLARGRRRALEVGIDPAQVAQALAKWQRLLGPTGPLEVTTDPARPDAGQPNPVFGLPELQGDPVAALAGHLVDEHGIGEDTTTWRTTRARLGRSASTTWTTPNTPTSNSATPTPAHGDQPGSAPGDRVRRSAGCCSCSYRSPTQSPHQPPPHQLETLTEPRLLVEAAAGGSDGSPTGVPVPPTPPLASGLRRRLTAPYHPLTRPRLTAPATPATRTTMSGGGREASGGGRSIAERLAGLAGRLTNRDRTCAGCCTSIGCSPPDSSLTWPSRAATPPSIAWPSSTSSA
jgi:hypothetical protein